MSVQSVVQLGDPRLWEPSSPVTDPGGVGGLVDDLHETLLHWRATTTYGRGIAAPQIGVAQRVVVVDLGERWVLVNPEIVDRSRDEIELWDACLSFLFIFFRVSRSARIDVRYQDMGGASHELRAERDLAELLQHEIDHLDGVLALDRMTDVRTMCTRDYFEAHHRHESPYAS